MVSVFCPICAEVLIDNLPDTDIANVWKMLDAKEAHDEYRHP
jgi:hypothetical protein